MARRNNIANITHTNGDVPPTSTIAAQIVQNQSRAAAPQQGGELKPLLQEILHNEDAVQETDINVNAQLIGVVAEAGLLCLTAENPFANWEELIAQARDSINVIEQTIKRQPEVLLTSLSNNGPPVLLGLLATLLSLCGKTRLQDLPVTGLLNSVIRILQASINLWQYAHHLQEVLQTCVDDVLSVLETSPRAKFMPDVKLPSVKSTRKLWPNSESSIAVPQGSSTTVNDTTWAFMLSLQLSQIAGLKPPWRRDIHLRLQRLVPRLKLNLQRNNQWDDVVVGLLNIPENWIFLASWLQEAAKNKQSTAIQTVIGKNLLTALEQKSRQTRTILSLPCRNLGKSNSFNDLNENLKTAVTTWLCHYHSEDGLPESIISMRDRLHQGDVMADQHFLTAFARSSSLNTEGALTSSVFKRRKASSAPSISTVETLKRRVAKLLTGMDSKDLSNISANAVVEYGNLSNEDQLNTWQCLIDLAPSDSRQVALIISQLLGYSGMQRSKQSRVLSMQAIKACVQHTDDANVVSLASSFGQFCLQSLHSSLRELRIAAGQALPGFLRDDLPDSIKGQNRHVALEYLRKISSRDVISEQETLVAAWARVGLACTEKELNLVLLRLVQYLEHPNSLICALAFSEIEQIADIKSMSVEELFKPFWPTIAVSVVQDLQAKPQKAQQVCDLLGKDVHEFLRLTQQETLPTLVLSKNHAVLRRIADARGQGSTVRHICMQPIANLAGIVTLLLNHFGPDNEEAALACLLDVDADFRQFDLSDLVKLDAGAIACEMLRYCGDQDEAKKPRAHQAFQTMVSLVERTPGQRKAHTKASSRAVASFFERHILSILTHFSIALVNGPGSQNIPEKARCLRGIEEMFSLAKGHVSIALPQIRACLQCGLDQPELCEVAFGAWLSLIPALESNDIAQIVDETFALILRYWPNLTPDSQTRTYDMIAELVRAHNQVLQERITTLPSLSGIRILSKFAAEFERFRSQENVEARCKAFVHRLQVDSDTIVLQALDELVPFLETYQGFVHEAAATEHPTPAITELLRAILDATVKYAHINPKASELCGKALGIVGCLDPNRVETVRNKRQVLVLSNFDKADEVVEWVMALFEDVLVKAFKSVTDARAQGFLAYIMQELLRSCNFTEASVLRSRSSQVPGTHHRWNEMPEHVRTTLTPFLTSRYHVTSMNGVIPSNRSYPGFLLEVSHSQWLRAWTSDLLLKAKGDNANMVFPLFLRIMRTHDLSIARWLLPYIVLNVVLGGTVAEVKNISDEILAVLSSKPANSSQVETSRLCSENCFAVLDYMSSWLREKSKTLAETRVAAFKTGNTPADFDEEKDMAQIETVETFFASIPAAVIAKQAMECRSYTRALFHWEQYIRQEKSSEPTESHIKSEDDAFERLVDIYAQMDEPDGLEGISAHLPIITEQQRALNHAKAGRWTAAQAWYELKLSTNSNDTQLQYDLLDCLRETGRYGSLLKYADSFLSEPKDNDKSRITLPHFSLALEASWMTEDMEGLEKRLNHRSSMLGTAFNVGIGRVLVHAAKGDTQLFLDDVSRMRRSIVDGLSTAGTDSLQACHEEMRKLHVLYEVENLMFAPPNRVSQVLETLAKRLNAVGSYTQDKQYILGLRRTMMRIRNDTFRSAQTGALWVSTAKLARQARNTSYAHNAVLKAIECGNRDGKLEEARLLWHEGHQRQAIQSLESAIESGLFDKVESETDTVMTEPASEVTTRAGSTLGLATSADRVNGHVQNKLLAKACLLLAKWLDASGQSQTNDMTERYQLAARHFQRWEKGHYHLGKHYSKLLDAQKALPREKRSQAFLTGEITRLVIDNCLRSIPFGNKYWHETIPRLLTLWLELGNDCEKKASRDEQTYLERRIKSLQTCNRQLQRYFERVPPYVFYHALPQLISRITHPYAEIWKQLCNILTRIVSTHPSQALWSMLAVIKARDRFRVERGTEVLNRMRDPKNKVKPDSPGLDLRTMITSCQRLSDGLLQACETPVEPRAVSANLFTDLGFNHKLAPNNLVVPIEATLTASSMIQATAEDIRKHKAFTQDKITIQSFREHVVVLSSLQRPRKITVRGSDGKEYGLLCKPKDDLRKDQRLMEFNGIINRALKRNTESSKRRLYIKTYAVTPLSEESGTIEWVEGIKPIRDILLNIYNRKGNRPNYSEIRQHLEEACSSPENAHLFQEKVLIKFPASLHEWFSATYPQPDVWFAARLRYARSAAVMSMTGHILGLGDRHGENILLEESTGGVFHVDFNCLFDKGLTFDKPELVPFRLTHNMVDAMGPYGHDGPFRRSCELTLSLLRQEHDTLMTVLETFLYDPTTDFVGKKKRSTAGVPETPAEILESVATKLRGLLRGETVPLSVEGHVDALIQEATDHFRLASMYIGWCSFL